MDISGCHECLSVFIGSMRVDWCGILFMDLCPKNEKKNGLFLIKYHKLLVKLQSITLKLS